MCVDVFAIIDDKTCNNLAVCDPFTEFSEHFTTKLIFILPHPRLS